MRPRTSNIAAATPCQRLPRQGCVREKIPASSFGHGRPSPPGAHLFPNTGIKMIDLAGCREEPVTAGWLGKEAAQRSDTALEPDRFDPLPAMRKVAGVLWVRNLTEAGWSPFSPTLFCPRQSIGLQIRAAVRLLSLSPARQWLSQAIAGPPPTDPKAPSDAVVPKPDTIGSALEQMIEYLKVTAYDGT
jgi:hypothetical protein